LDQIDAEENLDPGNAHVCEVRLVVCPHMARFNEETN
jgi:hypothetical protein